MQPNPSLCCVNKRIARFRSSKSTHQQNLQQKLWSVNISLKLRYHCPLFDSLTKAQANLDTSTQSTSCWSLRSVKWQYSIRHVACLRDCRKFGPCGLQPQSSAPLEISSGNDRGLWTEYPNHPNLNVALPKKICPHKKPQSLGMPTRHLGSRPSWMAWCEAFHSIMFWRTKPDQALESLKASQLEPAPLLPKEGRRTVECLTTPGKSCKIIPG